MSNNQIENRQLQIDQMRANVRSLRTSIKDIERQLQALVGKDPQQSAQMEANLLRQWDDRMDQLDDYLGQLAAAINRYHGLQEVQQFSQQRSQFIAVKQTHRNLTSDLKKEKEAFLAVETAEKKAIIQLNTPGHQRFVSETNLNIQEAQQRKQALESENDSNNADAINAITVLIQQMQSDLQTREQEYAAQSQIVAQLKQEKAAKEIGVAQLSQSIVANAQSMESILLEIDKVNDPRYLVNNFKDDTPFLLLPVRMETRYMKIKHVRRVIPGDTVPGFSLPDKDELWVRIFPDDIAINTHEKRLAADEEKAGHTYWTEIWGETTGEDGIDPQLGAWRVLVDAYGHERAAWIAKHTTPTNLMDDPLAEEPIFPTLELKPSSWTEMAKSYVMPDRFVVRIYTNEFDYREITGRSIPDPLPIGLDPSDEDETLFEQNQGEVVLPEGMGWLTDFKKAEEIGMGISIPLEGTEVNGIHRVLVLGLKLNADKTEATNLVEELFENHHYTTGGLSLIKQGTPTNNTEGSKSGYERLREDAKTSLEVELKDALFTSESEILDKKDGQWFADLMGLNTTVVDHVFHADGTDVCEAIAMNRALWPATMGYYIKQMLHPHVSKEDRNRVRQFFNDYVTGRGKIPAFRVDNQPYGVVMGTAFSRWGYGESMNAWEDFYNRLHRKVLHPMSLEWTRVANLNVKHVNLNSPESDRSQHFLDILGVHASSVEFHQRFANGTHKMWNLYNFLSASGDPTDLPDGFPILDGSEIFDFKTQYNSMLLLGLAEPAKVLELNFLEAQRLLNGPVIDGFDPFPFSEIRGIQSFPGTELNYIHWLIDPTTTIARIRTEEFDNLAGIDSMQKPPKALLYLLLRHACLQQYLETSSGLLIEAGVATSEAELEIELQGMNGETMLSEEEKALVLKGVTEELTITKKVQIAQQVIQEFQGRDPSRHQVRSREKELFAQSEQGLQQEINMTFNARLAAYKSKTRKWDYLTKSFGAVSGTLPMEDHIVALLGGGDPSTYDLASVKDSLDKLKGLPTARLERAFAEHLDLCNHRLDGWINGLVTQRLEKQQTASKGVYLGAYGILENLKPNSAHPGVHVVEVDGNQNVLSTSPDITEGFTYIGDTSADLERDPESGKVRALPTVDPTNQGFIHTPSVNHAVSAAILRAGYLANKEVGTEDNDNAMAVNLSSRRMRRALFYLEGVQNGQALSALLGYRLERELHDAVEDFIGEDGTLDQYILELRKKHPLNSGVISELDGGESIDKQEGRNVIDGLDLLNQYEEDEATYESIIYFLADEETVNKDKILLCIKKLQDDMDALADLLLSESVFQLAKGNMDRSGAVLKALGQGAYIQKPEIIETPRQSIAFTHRFGIQFDGSLSAADIWTDNGTARSMVEPGLNGWLSTQLPSADKIAFKTEYDTVVDEFVTTNQNTIYLSDLGIEPIDFISIIGDQGSGEDVNELSERIAHYVMQTYVLEDGINVRINYTDAVGLEADEFTFFQILALIKELKSVIGNSRPLTGDDFLLPNQVVDVPVSSITESRMRQVVGLDVGYSNSVSQLITDLNAVITAAGLPGELMPADPPTVLGDLRSEMLKVSAYGVKNAVPGVLFDNSEIARDNLVKYAQKLIAKLEDIWNQSTPLFMELSGATDMRTVNRLLSQIAEKLFGRSFKVFPEFTLANAVDVSTTRDNVNLLNEAGEMAVEEWTQGIAKVRPKMGRYQRLRLMVDSVLNIFTNEPVVTQLPVYPYPIPDGFEVDDARWIGMKLPDNYPVAGDTLSLVLELPDVVDAASVHSGMVIDEWTETIPLKNVHTGIAMHYNEPNAEAPNALIMAITPEETGEWEWDDLMDTLNETFQMAKNRAVEPDHLKDEIWGQTLPALLATIAPNDSAPSLDFARNVVNATNGQYGHISPADYAVE